MITVKFTKAVPDARIPSRSFADDAGFDISSSVDLTLSPHKYAAVPTGICIELPTRTEAQVRPRSGLAAKHGITVLNSPGTIDAGYRGEIKVILINHSDVDFQIEKGMRIAQLVIKPIYDVEFLEVTELENSDRGAVGFGSTGKR